MKITNMIAFIIFIITTSVFASTSTIHPNLANAQEIQQWKIETLKDGYIFILGEYSNKLLTININKMTASGKPADMVSVLCNEVHENIFREHLVAPGSNITCKGNFQDVSSMYILPENFNNG